MSGKSFEDRLRDSLESYPSPVDKEGMYNDFLQRSKKEDKSRRVIWLVFAMALFAGTFAFWPFSIEESGKEIRSVEDIDTEAESLTARGDMISSNSPSAMVPIANDKQSVTVSPNIEESDPVEAVRVTEIKESDRVLQVMDSKAPVNKSMNTEGEKGLSGLKQEVITQSFPLPLEANEEVIPFIQSRLAFLPFDKPMFHFNDWITNHSAGSNSGGQFRKSAFLQFSYGHLGATNTPNNIISNQIDRLGFVMGQQWQTKGNWLFGFELGFARYNLMQDGKILLRPSYDTLAVQAVLTMVQASFNGDFDNGPDVIETGYGLIQYQNALQGGLGIGKILQIGHKLDAEVSSTVFSEYIWRTGGEWSNPERGVYLDYPYESLNNLVFSIRGQAGLRIQVTRENMIRVGLSYQRDLSDRTSNSAYLNRFSGMGFYLGLSKYFN